MGGVENIWIKPGARVLYLGAASGTTVSHVADIVGPVCSPAALNSHIPLIQTLQTGVVYAVEFSARSGRDLINMAQKRPNVIPIVEDARYPNKYVHRCYLQLVMTNLPLRYRMLVGMVDVVFADVAQPDQARIISLNAHHFLKNGGHFVISIKANCIDSTVPAQHVFAAEVKKLISEQMKPKEQITLEPYERDHAVVVGVYRAPAGK